MRDNQSDALDVSTEAIASLGGRTGHLRLVRRGCAASVSGMGVRFSGHAEVPIRGEVKPI
jgi:hypothetical protein